MLFVFVVVFKDYVGKDFGYFEWFIIDQEWVDQFVECIGDYQFIYVDLEKVVKMFFGGIIVYGFLFLLLILKLMEGLLVFFEGLKMVVNYGFDMVCFIQLVWVGLWVCLGLILFDVNEKNFGQWLIKVCVILEIEGQEKFVYIVEIFSFCFV